MNIFLGLLCNVIALDCLQSLTWTIWDSNSNSNPTVSTSLALPSPLHTPKVPHPNLIMFLLFLKDKNNFQDKVQIQHHFTTITVWKVTVFWTCSTISYLICSALLSLHLPFLSLSSLLNYVLLSFPLCLTHSSSLTFWQNYSLITTRAAITVADVNL